MTKKQSLRDQTLRVVTLSLAILMGGVFLVASAIMITGFMGIEKQIVVNNIHRVDQVFKSFIEALEVKNKDWASWDDTYQYAVDHNDAYAISNLSVSSLSNLKLSHVVVLNEKDESIFGMSLDFQSITELPMPQDLLDQFKSRSPLLKRNNDLEVKSGVLMLSQEPVIFSAQAILTSHAQGPSHGTLIFAENFNQMRLDQLADIVKLTLKILPIDDKSILEEKVTVINNNTIAGYLPVFDAYGKPAFIFYLEMPRNIYKQAVASAGYLFVLLFIISAVFIYIIFLAIDKLFLRRLGQLATQVASIGTKGNFAGRIVLDGYDELSLVAHRINEMLEKIKTSQQQIMDDELRLHEKDKEFLEAQKSKVAELENINKLVMQRTKELERMHLANLNILEDFREAKKQAEGASEAKSQFIANMSHELRTPLNAILGFTDLLKGTSLDEKQMSYLDTVISAGKTLLMLVSDILDVSKAEAKQIVLEVANFDLKKTCQSAFDISAQRLLEKPITMRIDIAEDVPQWVKGDAPRLNQILLNVLGNAVKFTEKGSINFIIRREHGLDYEQSFGICFEVRDTGIGIPPDKLTHLFQTFGQIDGSTTRKFGGMGLGLVLSRNLANLMGGDIHVDSTPGTGSVFRVTVRFQQGVGDQYATGAAVTEAPKTSQVRVLVVEDSIPNQQLMKAYFKILGIQGDYMVNGREAVNHLSADPNYTLVFMDLQMPVMGGVEAADIIRKKISTELPIVALTASVTKEDRERCFSVGMNDFLSKPIEINKLKEVVKRYAVGRSMKLQDRSDVDIKSTILNLGTDIGLDPQEYQQLLMTSLPVIDEDKKLLNAAITQLDYPTIKLIAHKFKGTLANLRLNELSQIALELEFLAKDQAAQAHLRAKENDFVHLLEKIRKAVS